MLVSRGRIVRSATVPVHEVDDQPQPGEALAALLDALPRRRFRKSRVVIALGPAFAQTRHLSRLPALRDAGALASVVRTNVGRFFIKNGIPLTTSSVQLVHEGEGWACAVEQPMLEELAAVCRARNLRLDMLVPALVTLPYASTATVVRWTEGDSDLEARYASTGQLESVRRLPLTYVEPARPLGVSGTAAEKESPDTKPELWASALGAARIPRSEALAIRPTNSELVPRWRVGIAVTVLGIAITLAVARPMVAQHRAAQIADVELRGLARERAAAIVTDRELAITTRTLAEIAAFASSRRSVTLFLGKLTEALGDGVSLVSLRLDDTGGSLVALAPRAVDVVSQLGDVPDVVEPAIVGAVTPEAMNGERLERVTVRFRWRGQASAASNARTGKGAR
jgi:hypothetical protein